MDLSLARIEERLAGHAPNEPPSGPKRAAVAALLRFDREAPDVLLMKRAFRDGDRWSGQVSFPGGREERRDPDLLSTAVRETREEVGLDLARTARLLGRLEPLRPVSGGGVVVAPFVFARTREEPVALGDEAVSTFWLPLDRAVSGELDDVYHYRKGDVDLPFPCWRYLDQVVWGLTYRMLNSLLDVVTGRAV